MMTPPSVQRAAMLMATTLVLCTVAYTTLACKNGSPPPPGKVCCGDAIVSGTGSSNGMECCSGIPFYAGTWVTNGVNRTNVCALTKIYNIPVSALDGGIIYNPTPAPTPTPNTCLPIDGVCAVASIPQGDCCTWLTCTESCGELPGDCIATCRKACGAGSPWGGPGSSCSSSSDCCDGLWCSGAGSTCLKPGEQGEPCDGSLSDQCKTGLNCVDGKCAKTCAGPYENCSELKCCDTSYECEEGPGRDPFATYFYCSFKG